jgi:hypothetical protein
MTRPDEGWIANTDDGKCSDPEFHPNMCRCFHESWYRFGRARDNIRAIQERSENSE